MNCECVRNPWRMVILLIVTLFAGSLALQKVSDYDVWWHLRTGRWMVENGAFPQVDPFSFSTLGSPWHYVYGLSDPLLFLLYKWFGIGGPQFYMVFAIAFAAVVLFLFLQRRIPVGVAALLTIAALQAARFRFMVRPLVVKFAGVVFLFWFFYRKGDLRYRYPIFFLAVLCWNWLYPAAFIAQIFAAGLVVEKGFERVTGSGRYRRGGCRDAVILLGLASLAILLNPNGFELYRLAFGGLFAEQVFFVEEQQTLVWSQFPLFSALVLLAAGSFLVGRRNFRLLTPLLFIAFVGLAWSSSRFAGVAAFAMAGIIGVNLDGVFQSMPYLQRLAREKWVNPFSVLVVLTMCVVFWGLTYRKTQAVEFGVGVNQSRYPYAAVEMLRESGFSGNLYNSWKFGGFLLWQLPEAKTFIDGRCLPDQLTLYQRFSSIDRHEFARYLGENRVQAALLDRQEVRDIDLFANMPGYRQVYADDISVLFARNDLELASASGAPGRYRYLRLGGYEFEYLAPLAVGPESSAVEDELRSALRQAPESFFENFILAYFYQVRKDPRAAAQYQVAIQKNPAFAVTHFDAGRLGVQAALEARQWDMAVTLATLALEYRQTGELYFLLGAGQHQLRQLQAAEKSYRTSLALAENGRVRNNLGFLLLEMEQPKAARDAFSKDLETRRGLDREQSLYGLALSLGRLQLTAEAASMRDRLAAEFPQSQYLQKLRLQ